MLPMVLNPTKIIGIRTTRLSVKPQQYRQHARFRSLILKQAPSKPTYSKILNYYVTGETFDRLIQHRLVLSPLIFLSPIDVMGIWA